MSIPAAVVTLPTTPFPPIAVGFMGLGTGYLIYGTQELFGFPSRGDEGVDYGTGIWGIWMPGFMQFFTGIFLFLALTLFGTLASPPLYMTALAFTAYGVHWVAMGWNRIHGVDPRVNVGMTVAFMLISILGIIVFFKAHDAPVGALFIGLLGVYVADFFASLKPNLPGVGEVAEKVLGLFHLGTGFWLMYLMFATVLNFTLKYTLPL
ncbi:MAG: hypothetical protein JWM17_304 [Actinobacteria bacterium]|nr:hypothetical protein [Actinomycetota bacterium]MCW3044926.1 hypothetical protein [Actinomycetota bacterium]